METGQKSESPAGKPAGLLGCCEKKGIGSAFLQRGVFLVQRFLAREVGLDASMAWRICNVAALPCSLIPTPPDDEQSPGIFHLQEDFE